MSDAPRGTDRPGGPGYRLADVPPGGIAAGVADMGLAPPPEVLVAAHAALDAHVGYPSVAELDAVRDAADAWWQERHGLALVPGRTAVTRSAVAAIAGLLGRWTAPGDVVVRAVPGYPPLGQAVLGTRCVDRTVELVPDPATPTRLVVDPDDLDAALAGAAVLLWVQPGNPAGTVPTRSELEQVVDVAARHDVLVVSDEVWADLVHAPHRHVPLAVVAAERAPDLRVVTVTGATKTFDVAGLGATLATSSHDDVHAALVGPGRVPLLSAPSVAGLAGSAAAYRHGGPWLDAVLALLRRNRDVASATLRELLGPESVAEAEGTYLLWVRAPRSWGDDPATHLLEQAGVVVTDGAGMDGPGWVRLNLAAPAPTVDDLLARLVAAT